MKIVNLLWVLPVVLLGGRISAAPIEVIVNGVSYDSLEAYRTSKIGPLKAKPAAAVMGPAPETKPSTPISGPTADKLDKIGYEKGVTKVIVDFRQDWNNPVPKFYVTNKDLEERLKALIEGREEPVMVVSGARKLRVMELETKPAAP